MERFSVVAAYEDVFTHNRVREVCDGLLDQFWGEIEFDVEWWSFRRLQHPSSSLRATRLAAEAHLIIVSAHPREALPMHVQQWCERWGNARQRSWGALAALIGSSMEEGASPIAAYLRDLARRARLDFLPHPMTDLSRLNAPAPPGSRHPEGDVAEGLNRLLDPRRPPSHWGINE
ncbi:MAG: hypothetical protein JXQ71_11660 [Verrucomicrobia bacterium]|nr:hypothetical protein [Verrucomicrobiota bacterium]